jgi:hypothetical protein
MKHLGNILICGAAYPVLEGNSSDEDVLESAHGVCKTAERQIWVHEGLTDAKRNDTLVHETLHAINNDSGLIYALAAAFGVASDDTRLMPAEEMLVRILTPHVLAAFGAPVLGGGPRKQKARRTR